MGADGSIVASPEASARRMAGYWLSLREGAGRVLAPGRLDDAPERSYLWPRLVYSKPFKDSIAGSPLRRWLELEKTEFSGFPMPAPAAFLERLGDSPFRYETGDAGAARNLRAAVALVASVWPEAADELARTALGVAWISSEDGRVESFSDPQRFGVIHLSLAIYGAAPPEQVATALVHETAHHALFVETSVDPLIPEDFQKPLYSPIRRETRPAIGVLHGAFAASRMGQWTVRLARLHPDAAAGAEAARVRRRYLKSLRPTLDGLRAVRFSRRGSELLTAMENGLAELERVDG